MIRVWCTAEDEEEEAKGSSNERLECGASERALWVLCERGRANGGRESGEAVGPDLPIEVYVQEPGAGVQEM